MSLLDIHQQIAKLSAELVVLKARVNRVITPDAQFRWDGSTTVGVLPTHTHAGSGQGGLVVHDVLSQLADDDHTQYARLAGRAGGQALQGGTAASENLTLESTSHATKGTVIIRNIARLRAEGLGDAYTTAFLIHDETNEHGRLETVATKTTGPGADSVGLHLAGIVSDRDVGFTTPSGRAMRWYVGTSQKIHLDSGGQVGIGTATPTAMLDVNSDTLRLRTARTPGSAGAAGNPGDICWDGSYIYVCVAGSTWRRATHNTW